MKTDCTTKAEIIQGILNTTLDDESKIYFIQSYLLGWINEAYMLDLIKHRKVVEYEV